MLYSSTDFGASYIAEVVALLIVIALVARYVWPRISALMDRAATSIATKLDAAEEARRQGAALVLERREALERAKEEAAEIVAQARRSAEALIVEGERRATAEYERLVGRAVLEIERETLVLRNEVASELASVVLSLTEEVVVAELDSTRQHRLIGEAIDAAAAEGGAR